MTTAHQADDVRIYERECTSLATVPGYRVGIAAPGRLPAGSSVRQLQLPDPPVRRASRFMKSAPRAAWALRRVHADVYHFHDPELLPLAVAYCRRGSTVVWDAHEDYVTELDVAGPKDWVPGPLRGFVTAGMGSLLRSIDRHAAAIVAATPDIAAGYRNPNTVVVGNEARVTDFAACQPDFSSRRILYTGHVGDQHCFRELAQAIQQAGAGLELVVAGKAPDPDVWEFAQDVLGDRLVHVGWVDRDGLRGLITSSCLGLVTYADIRTNDANSPNKLFEFAAAGLPVVTTPNPGISTAVQQSRGGVVAGSFWADGFAEAIKRALADEGAWHTMSAHARNWVAEHGSWERTERVLLQMYEHLEIAGT